MALEDPRDKDTRGQRSRDKGSRDRKGGGGPRGNADRSRSGGRGAGGSTVGGMGIDAAGFGFNRQDLSRKNIGNPDVNANAKSLKDKLDKARVNQTNLSQEERDQFARNLHGMSRAYTDSLDDGTGGIFSGLTPFGEINPYEDPKFSFGQIDPNTGQPQVDANWGFDYGGLIAGLAGKAFGIPLTDALYYGAKKIGAIPSDFAVANVGSSVFGQPDSVPQTAANPDAQPGGGVAPEPVAQSRSPLNNRIGGYSGGGYNMGAFGKKPSKKTNYLTQQLMAP